MNLWKFIEPIAMFLFSDKVFFFYVGLHCYVIEKGMHEGTAVSNFFTVVLLILTTIMIYVKATFKILKTEKPDEKEAK